MDLSWMAWTTPTAVFFIAIATGLTCMTVWELLQPTVARQGFLPIATTRGDRFFLSLLTGAWIHLFWLGLTDLALWYALAIMAVWMFVLMRWG